jgi:hypothetical protein
MRPITTSRGVTTRRLDCTGSTAPMPCIRTRRPAARLLIGRSHWPSPCVRSQLIAARLLVIRIAPALLCLCHASGRVVSTLDFSLVGRTGSHRVPGRSIVRRDYPSRGHNGYTSPTLCVRVPRHVPRLVTWLVIDYSVRRDFVLRPHWLYFSHIVCHDYLSHSKTGSTSSTASAAATSSSGRIASTIHLD